MLRTRLHSVYYNCYQPWLECLVDYLSTVKGKKTKIKQNQRQVLTKNNLKDHKSRQRKNTKYSWQKKVKKQQELDFFHNVKQNWNEEALFEGHFCNSGFQKGKSPLKILPGGRDGALFIHMPQPDRQWMT